MDPARCPLQEGRRPTTQEEGKEGWPRRRRTLNSSLLRHKTLRSVFCAVLEHDGCLLARLARIWHTVYGIWHLGRLAVLFDEGASGIAFCGWWDLLAEVALLN